ncbi:MAG TPA: phosphotransferase [Actinomycetota bacterium]|nr:phosphotransferase [Actinomycetota bacterium]
MNEWRPDLEVLEDLARSLIAEQFPEFELRSLRYLGEGWDNIVWLANEEFAFRFPRREIAVRGVEREIGVLPQLAPHLPVAIPQPRFVGQPSDRFAWPFYGGPILPGGELPEVGLGEDARRNLAPAIGSFLRTLHSDAVAEAVDFPLDVDPNARGDMTRRVPKTRAVLDEAEKLGLWTAPPEVAELLDTAEKLPALESSKTVLHGDLHFRHVLVDDDGTPTGVIDWGDVCRGNRAIDLSLAWGLFEPDTRAAFFDAYGEVSADEAVRAQVVALCLNAVLAVYGHHQEMKDVEREAVTGLGRITAS